MALPNCAVFNFHQTPPANAATITMHTARITRTGGRFGGAASATISGATTISVAIAGSTWGDFSTGLSNSAGAGAELIFATTGVLSGAGTAGTVTVATETGATGKTTFGCGTDGTTLPSFGGSTAVVCSGLGAGSNLMTAVCADSAKRSSSSGLSAPSTSSASRLRLRMSLSLNAKGHSENASSSPITRRRPHSGTATMDRAPSLRQASTFTLGSVSVSSHITTCAVRKQAPEKAESRSMRAPTSGRTEPADARKTISLFSASAIARPSAPVMATARSATN